MASKDLLFELRTEELPPKSVEPFIDHLVKQIGDGLNEAAFNYVSITGYATPRRLALVIKDLDEREPDKVVERRGPALQAAYDSDGNPTKALLGFARSCGIEDLGLLEQLQTPKGAWLVARQQQTGRYIGDCIATMISDALASLPVDRKMRWGASREEFPRPVHSSILLYGDDILPATWYGCQTGRETVGHPFMSQGNVHIKVAGDYAEQLRSHYVIADLQERKAIIRQQLADIETEQAATVVIDETLLDEVTALVEWPVCLLGKFDPAFLEVPEEALISAMKSHQRYFHLVDSNDKLMARFITVANLASKDPQAVIRGNERVISPRLSDADFFFTRDKQTPLQNSLDKLGTVIFQAKLGTYLDKANRIANLAETIAGQIGADPAHAHRAGLLCKTDLVSDMVGEFPDLQGIMGCYYATCQGEPDAVAQAIGEHYMPTASGAAVPATSVGQAVAIADKLDTLTGLFGIKQPPSGSKDPFALRRQTLGVLRTCIEYRLSLSLSSVLEQAAAHYSPPFATADVFTYMLDRLGTWYQDNGVALDIFNAVRHGSHPIDNLADCDDRVRCLTQFRSNTAADSLIAANKRVANILKKAELVTTPIDPDLFEAPAEQALFAALEQLRADKADLGGDYTRQCELLAGLQPVIDSYFADVMVLVDDEAIRTNRLATLTMMRALFLDIADFSLLQE